MLKDVLVVGSATISNNILSGFSSSSYGYINEALPLSSNTVELVLDLNITSFNNYDVIMANYNDSYTGGGFVLRTDKRDAGTQLLIWGTNNNTGWTTSGARTGISLSTGRNILKIKYNAGTLQLSNSVDGGNTFTDGNIITATFTDFVQPFRFGVSGSNFPATNMSINLLNSYIKVNGEYWHSYQRKLGTKIIQRHDTAANWTSVNPILAAGEIGVETDTSKFKFGDGVTAWNSLSYAAGEGGGGSGTTLISTDGTTTYNKLALGNTLSVTDTSTKELNGLTQTGGTLNSELEFTGASGASLKMTEKYSLSTADSWEFQIKYKHNRGGQNPAVFGYASGSDYKTPSFILEGGSFKFFLSSSGDSWNINSSRSGLVPQTGTIYYFKVGFTGSQYYVKYNTTGWSNEFTTQWTLNSTTKVYCSDYFMLMNLSLNRGYYNNGTMYLQDTALIINGEEVWRGSRVIQGDIILNANAYTKAETDNLLNNKQDKLTAEKPLNIGIKDIRKLNVIENITGGNLTNTYNYTLGSAMGGTGYGLVSNEVIDFNTADTWEVVLKTTFDKGGSDIQVPINIISTLTPGFSILYYYASGYLYIKQRISTNGSTWAYDKNTPTSGINISSISSFKIRFDGTSYTFEYSLDNVEYKTLTTYRESAHIQNSKIGICEYISSNNYWAGTVSLTDSYYKINDTITQLGIIQEGTLTINSEVATSTSLGVVQPDGTTITVNEAGVISGQDVKTFTGYSDTGTLVLKSINGVLQWVAEG